MPVSMFLFCKFICIIFFYISRISDVIYLFFHLFVLPSVSFISILQFSEYRSFASLSRFIPVYFILFDETGNGLVFLISLSDLLLLVFRNTTDFCILILYTMTLPNSLMISSSFLIMSSGYTV